MADAILVLGGRADAGQSAEIFEQLNLSAKRRYPSPQPSPARGEGAGCDLRNSVPSPLAGEGQDEGAFFKSAANIFSAQIVPHITGEMRARPFLAFCGIGRPAKFFDTLAEAGVTVVKSRSFPDHHPYTEADARALLAEAKTLKARLVTTSKDLVRLKGTSGALAELHGAALALPITVEYSGDGEAALLKAILSRI